MERMERLEVDGVPFEVRFQGFDRPLGVRLAGGGEVSLAPWTCREHLRALGLYLVPGQEGLTLDAPGFCGEVLARSGLSGAQADALAPLALWWASGGGETRAARAGDDGELRLGAYRFQLRPWTQGERMKALADGLGTRPEGGPAFDAATYLGAMLRASVRSVSPSGQQLEDLDAATTAGLLEAVVALNVPDGDSEGALQEQLRLGTQEMAATTLRLCRALGWTPSQVWATPAPEVDRLLRLLDHVEGPAAVPPGRAPLARPRAPRLADHPDAIVIQIEDDPA